MRLFTSRHAESLVESIIAITVIVLATTAALSLIRTSISGNRVIEEKVVAVNLALEGIEAIKNIRDTNYLTFSSKPEDCWDVVDDVDISQCDTSYGTPTATLMRDLAGDGNTYYLNRLIRSADQRFSWEISNNSAFGDLTHYGIYSPSGTVLLTELYAQSGLEVFDSRVYQVIEENAFVRSIEFSENSYDSSNAVDVTVTVTWESRGQDYSVSLTRTIANIY